MRNAILLTGLFSLISAIGCGPDTSVTQLPADNPPFQYSADEQAAMNASVEGN